MIGAIIGDIVGSRFEFHPIKTKQFDLFQEGSERKTLANYINCSRFTDDTVMTLAVCKTLIDCKGNYIDLEAKLIQNMKQFGKVIHMLDMDVGLISGFYHMIQNRITRLEM